MATAKKTPAKPAFRTDYKPDARVKVKRITGEVVTGRVVGTFTKKTGAFIQVNIGTKDRPLIKDFRPAVVKGY